MGSKLEGGSGERDSGLCELSNDRESSLRESQLVSHDQSQAVHAYEPSTYAAREFFEFGKLQDPIGLILFPLNDFLMSATQLIRDEELLQHWEALLKDSELLFRPRP